MSSAVETQQAIHRYLDPVKRYFVYMLRCADGKFYVGITNDPRRRLSEHQAGMDAGAFTYSRRPVDMVYREEFQWVQHAIAWEKQLKKWSSAKKQALVNGDFDAVHLLAKCLNATRHDREEGGSV